MSRGAGRFAPSPTGDLHLGGARTALGAWLLARSTGRRFVLRVEDLDAPRVRPGAEARILSDLAWLGLDWDEGPEIGGAHGPYRQSERLARYDAAIDRLLSTGHAFVCACSRAEVARASVAGAPHGPDDEGPRYPGTCRDLPSAVVEQRARALGRRPSVRFRADGPPVEWHDLLWGPQRDRVDEQVGDFVIRRSDGVHAYQLAVVVDDGAMCIDEVVRGDDLRSSTARQLLLHRALGQPAPGRWLHLPLILGPDGARLSKRHGAIGLEPLRARGLSGGEALGRLAATLGLATPGEALRPEALLDRLAIERLPRAPTRLDPATL